MNIKIHTPKSLKKGSGLSSIKQFLLSILATTVSIVLTFGTAALIDKHKKNASKKEMVMMVISDMDKTIKMIQEADTSLREAKRLQMELVEYPERFDSLHNIIPSLLTRVFNDYSETTEKIFTTSIETFNTIGDVNFVNEVSLFYMARHNYKESLLGKLQEDIQEYSDRVSLKALMNISFPDYVCDNLVCLEDLTDSRDRCMQMMNVSEKDLIKFNKQQQEKENADQDDNSLLQMFNECDSCNAAIERAKEKLKD